MRNLISTMSPRRFSARCSKKPAGIKNCPAMRLANEFATLNLKLVHQVVNEAELLTAATPFPGLFLPALAEEKVRETSVWAARQRAIHDEPMAFAAQ